MKSARSNPRSFAAAPDAAERANRHNFRVGLILAVVNTVIGAMQPVVTRYGALRIDPLLFCAGTVGVAGVCIAPVLYRAGELRQLFSGHYVLRLFAISAVGTIATTFSLIYGLREVNAISGVLLLQTEPIYSLLLATLVVGERPSLRQVTATVAILAGISFAVGTGGGVAGTTGAIALLMTPLFWQTSHVLCLPVMPPLSPTCIAGARYIFAAIVLAPVLVWSGSANLRQLAAPAPAAVILLTGTVIYAIGSSTWYGAISRLSLAWTTALVVPGIPLLTILFAIAFLGEKVSGRELAGIAIAIAGVIALVLGADPHRRHPDIETLESVHQPIS